MVMKLDLEKSAQVQQILSSKLILKWDNRKVNLVAGVDFGYDSDEKRIGASVIVFKFPELEIVELSEAIEEVKFPYIPGYLSFREGPVFFEAFRKIRKKPDVTLIDGNGIAHPRKMGLASFVGIVQDISTIGCAKKSFFPFVLPSEEKGAYTFFKNDKEEKVGICLRTRSGVKPIFVSPGHRINFMSAMKIVLCCSKFRIPEPLREAHKRANKIFSKT